MSTKGPIGMRPCSVKDDLPRLIVATSERRAKDNISRTLEPGKTNGFTIKWCMIKRRHKTVFRISWINLLEMSDVMLRDNLLKMITASHVETSSLYGPCSTCNIAEAFLSIFVRSPLIFMPLIDDFPSIVDGLTCLAFRISILFLTDVIKFHRRNGDGSKHPIRNMGNLISLFLSNLIPISKNAKKGTVYVNMNISAMICQDDRHFTVPSNCHTYTVDNLIHVKDKNVIWAKPL